MSHGRIAARRSKIPNAVWTWAIVSDCMTSRSTLGTVMLPTNGTPASVSCFWTSLRVSVRSTDTTPLRPLETVSTCSTCSWAIRLARSHSSATLSLVTTRWITSLIRFFNPAVIGAASGAARSGRTLATSAWMSTWA